MMFETLQNKDVDKLPGRMLSTSYYTDFYGECKLFEAMPDKMIDMFYSTNSVKENVTLNNNVIIEFFNESGQNVDLDLNDVRIHSPRDIMKQCQHNKAYASENNAQFDRIVRYCLNICNAAKIENGAKGGKSGVKPVIVLKDINKYKLKVGDSYDPMNGTLAMDIYGNDITSYIRVQGTVDNKTPGVYTIEYILNDNFGTNLSYFRHITVTE